MKFIIATKLGMTQLFDPDGRVVAVTLVSAPPMSVIREKSRERDGYQALVLGTGRRNALRIPKAQRAAWGDLVPPSTGFAAVREIRLPHGQSGGMSGKIRGARLDCAQFEAGDIVKVSGVSKGKGFQGVVKRHGFHGAPKTHGTKHAHRQPGSIGATWPQRVIKGRRMAGRMGGERVTVRNLEVVKIDPERQLIALKGAVPGRRGTLLEIRG